MNRAKLSSSWRLAIKVTVATLVCIGLMLGAGFSPVNAAIALMTVVYAVGSTFGGSIEIGIHRSIGTVIGCLIGAAFVLVPVQAPLWIGASVAVGVTLFCCALLPLRLGFRLAAGLAGSIVLLPGPDVWLTVEERVLGTLAGIAAALIVDALLYPTRTRPRVRELLAETISSCAGAIDTAFGIAVTGEGAPEDIHGEVLARLVEANELITSISYQGMLSPDETADVTELAARVRDVIGTVDAMNRSAAGLHRVLEDSSAGNEMTQLRFAVAQAFTAVGDRLRGSGSDPVADIAECAEMAREALALQGPQIRDIGRAYAFIFEAEVAVGHLRYIEQNLEQPHRLNRLFAPFAHAERTAGK